MRRADSGCFSVRMNSSSDAALSLPHREILTRLALNDSSFVNLVLDGGYHNVQISRLDARTHALARLAALLTLGASGAAYASAVADAFAGGATVDELVGVLVAITPSIGIVRSVSVAPDLALAVGFDVDDVFEEQ
jgi:4-carboxymuconolactone decarboxylase